MPATPETPRRTLRIAMNGVTGRMGYRQHLLRSILPLRESGLRLDDGTRVDVEPILIGRNAEKIADLAAEHGIASWTTDTASVIADPTVDVYFDAQVTSRRMEALSGAIKAGKHVYTEKPTAETLTEAIELARMAENAGVVAGVVHDKLYLPGLVKLRRPHRRRLFGRILSMRGEFGYWVFEGDSRGRPAAQLELPRRGWRRYHRGHVLPPELCDGGSAGHRADGDRAAPPPTSRPAGTSRAEAYAATADDAAYGIFEIEGGIIAQINSSWTVRVHRDELVEFQIDGTHGSAVAGLRGCVAQQRAPHPETGVEPRPSGHRGGSATSGWKSRPTPTSTTVSSCSGGVPARCRRRRALTCFGLLSAARGRATGRTRSAQPAEDAASRSRRSRCDRHDRGGDTRAAPADRRCCAPTSSVSLRTLASARPPDHLLDRLRGSACRAKGDRGSTSRRTRGPGLGHHAGLPPRAVVLWSGCRRGDGHRPTGDGTGLGRPPAS